MTWRVPNTGGHYDGRLKIALRPIHNVLDKVSRLDGTDFHWNVDVYVPTAKITHLGKMAPAESAIRCSPTEHDRSTYRYLARPLPPASVCPAAAGPARRARRPA